MSMQTEVAFSLESLAKPKAKKEKGGMPALTKPELMKTTEAIRLAIEKFKDAEAEKKRTQADGILAVEPLRMALCRQTGENLSSVKINGITYVHKVPHHTASIGVDREPAISALFGDRFPAYFVKKYEISVDPTKLSPELLKALNAAGAEFTVTIKPTRQYHDDRTMLADVAAKSEQVPEIKPQQYFQ